MQVQAATHTVTCHTPGCINNGVPIQMPLVFDEDTGDGLIHTDSSADVQCGPCGQPITDVVAL